MHDCLGHALRTSDRLRVTETVPTFADREARPLTEAHVRREEEVRRGELLQRVETALHQDLLTLRIRVRETRDDEE